MFNRFINEKQKDREQVDDIEIYILELEGESHSNYQLELEKVKEPSVATEIGSASGRCLLGLVCW